MTNPYGGLKDYQFWRRSVSRTEPHRFDPVVNPKFRIPADAKVATAGSCFAQHIARKLTEIDFNYYVPEHGGHLEPDERRRRNYGVFSARYGNLYTTGQLDQLYEEAFGRRTPAEVAWTRPDGRMVDPFRPNIEPDGFADTDEVRAERAIHLEHVRAVFLEADVFIFTLGLTEAWRSKRDGSVYPLAPGTAGGAYDPVEAEFVNFGVDEVERDLLSFLDKIKADNPKVKVVLTVSPVPLVATYEDRNVLVSTTYSKAVLRVVADKMARRFDWVDYFPSYEIITGSFSGGLYYEEDYREVNRRGVAHAMRCFARNYIEQPDVSAPAKPFGGLVMSDKDLVICDEETLDAVRF